MKIELTNLVDEHECDQCCGSITHGHKIVFDDVVIVNKEPCAHCCDNISFISHDPFKDISNQLRGRHQEFSSEYFYENFVGQEDYTNMDEYQAWSKKKHKYREYLRDFCKNHSIEFVESNQRKNW